MADRSQALPYYNRGNRYLNQGRYEDAINDYKTALSYYDQDPDFYTNLGVALRQTDDIIGAQECFRKAAELSPDDWAVWNDLANTYLKQNNLSQTIATFKRALKCNPPAKDRAAIEQDITDITKILKMQTPPAMASPPTAQQKKSTAAAPAQHAHKQTGSASKTAADASLSHPATSTRSTRKASGPDSSTTSANTTQGPAAPSEQITDTKALHDSGWDYTMH